MAELKPETIEAISKINDAVKETNFYVNRFSLSDNYNGEQIIELDIREKKEEEENP